MRNFAKTAFALALSAAALSAVTAPASALVVANSVGSNFFRFADAAVFVPINVVGGIATPTLPFRLAAPAKVVITFAAECSVDAPAGAEAGIDIDIVVDGTSIGGTGGPFQVLCSADGTPGFSNFTHPSFTEVASLPAGRHVVAVFARLLGGATGGHISDSTVVVER